MIDLNVFRNKEGFIEVENSLVNKIEEEIRGNAEKKWLNLVDERRFLFKTALCTDVPVEGVLYQFYSALLTSEISNMLGISCAQYDLAIYNGKIGIISPDFLIPGETMLSGADMIANVYLNYGETFDDCLKDLKYLFDLYFEDDFKSLEFYEEFAINHFILDFIFGMFDKHHGNWGIIKIGNGYDYRLAPRYDTDLIAETYLGKERIEELIKLYDPQTGTKPNELDLWSDELEIKFGYRNMYPRNNLDMECFCSENYEIAKRGYELVSKIDVIKAFDNIEAKIGTELPEEYKQWLTIVINYRIGVIKRSLLKVEENKVFENVLNSSNKR